MSWISLKQNTAQAHLPCDWYLGRAFATAVRNSPDRITFVAVFPLIHPEPLARIDLKAEKLKLRYEEPNTQPRPAK